MRVLLALTVMGEKGWGGCTYCNNQTFNPAYCRTEKTITEQLEEGKLFRAKVSGHEVSGLFPSLYEYVWRSG